MAPLAQHDLAAEIDADALAVEDVWAEEIVRDPDEGGWRERTVIAWVDVEVRPDVAAWLNGADGDAEGDDDRRAVRTDWIFLPTIPEAVLIGVVEGEAAGVAFRFNVRVAADPYRSQLEALAGSGLLGLTTEPLQLGPERRLESPCVLVPVQTGPLRDFLRELPPVPVV
jgi:hypothetical protein